MIFFYPFNLGKNITGAALYYQYITLLLEKSGKPIGLNPVDIKDSDTLVANAGPLGYIFHYNRWKRKGKYRIIRDVQTTFEPGYLLQEVLCAELTEPQDIILFPSEYTRQAYCMIFDHLNENNTRVSYPMGFPEFRISKPKEFTVGYLGRGTAAKGFPQFLNIVKDIKGKVLIAGEEFHNLPDNVECIGMLPPDKIWSFFEKVSVLVFPSTANIESLGRVILEANHAQIPVVAAEFGASPELCPNLVKVSPRKGIVSLEYTEPLAYVDESDFLNKIHSSLKLADHSFYKKQDQRFLDIVHNIPVKKHRPELNPNVQSFLKNTKIYINISHNYSNAITKLIEQLNRLDITNIGKSGFDAAKTVGFEIKWKHLSSRIQEKLRKD